MLQRINKKKTERDQERTCHTPWLSFEKNKLMEQHLNHITQQPFSTKIPRANNPLNLRYPLYIMNSFLSSHLEPTSQVSFQGKLKKQSSKSFSSDFNSLSQNSGREKPSPKAHLIRVKYSNYKGILNSTLIQSFMTFFPFSFQECPNTSTLLEFTVLL